MNGKNKNKNGKHEKKKERKMDHGIKVQHQHIPHPNLTTSQTHMPVEATQSLSPMTGWGDKTPDWMGMRGPDGTEPWIWAQEPDWLASMDGGPLGMPVQGLQQYGRSVGGLGR